MKLNSTLLLKVALFFASLVVLMLCLVPLEEGLGEVTSIIAFYNVTTAYVTALLFFLGVYQAWKLLTYIDTNKAFSERSVNALKNIQNYALIAFLVTTSWLPSFYKFALADDAPGVMVIALALSGTPFVIATFAAILKKILQDAMALKSENDLTV